MGMASAIVNLGEFMFMRCALPQLDDLLVLCAFAKQGVTSERTESDSSQAVSGVPVKVSSTTVALGWR